MANHSISEIFARIISTARQQGNISIKEVLSLLGGRSILLAMLLFALINSLPIPGIPGVSTVTGIPILFLAFQVTIGSKAIWLPKKVIAYRLHSEKLFAQMEKAIPTLKKIERRLKPRLEFLSDRPFSNLIGLAIFALGVVLVLPIPLMNFPMGFTISILTIGLLERDGFLILAGFLFTAVMLILFPVVIADGISHFFS